MGRHLRAVREEIRRRADDPCQHLGHRILVRRGAGSLGRVPLARDAGASAVSASLFPRRIAQRAENSCRTTTSRAAQFVGSWAGAMGQTQFMPSSYLTYAVDFDGDGRARHLDAACPTCSPRSRIICRNRAGSRVCRGASKSSCRTASTTAQAAARSATGVERGLQARRRRRVSRNRRRHPVFSERRRGPGLSRHREFHRAQAVQQFGRLCARGRRTLPTGCAALGPIRARMAGRRFPAVTRRAHRAAAPARRARLQGSAISTATSISTCATTFANCSGNSA